MGFVPLLRSPSITNGEDGCHLPRFRTQGLLIGTVRSHVLATRRMKADHDVDMVDADITDSEDVDEQRPGINLN